MKNKEVLYQFLEAHGVLEEFNDNVTIDIKDVVDCNIILDAFPWNHSKMGIDCWSNISFLWEDMFDKKIVSLDLDSTLVDIMVPWIEYINLKEGTNIDKSHHTSYNMDVLQRNIDFIETEFYDNEDLKPIDGAIELVKELSRKCHVRIVTHTFDGHRESKLRFIKRFFGEYIEVICTNECKKDATKDTILIDDALHHIEKHIDNGGVGALYTMNDEHMYNKHSNPYITNVRNYEDVLNFIEENNKVIL